MDPELGEKDPALPLSLRPAFFPWECQTTLNHRLGETTARVTHGILLVTAGRLTGGRLARTNLAPDGCFAELIMEGNA